MNKTTLNSQEEKYSMLSLRRATFVGLAAHRLRNISIHALLAESDILPGRLGFLNFPTFIKRLAMSVVFLLLAAGVMLAGLWVLSTLMPIR